MNTVEPETGPDARRVTKGHITLWAVLCFLPVIAAFVLQWLPIFNGPHLFLGLPAILWWTCVPGSLFITVVLVIIEKTRPDLERQSHLDDLALEADAAREADDARKVDAARETETTSPTVRRSFDDGAEG